MMNMRDISSDVTPAKVSEVKPVEAPKEIGETKHSNLETPKEIGETSAPNKEIPHEIGENAMQPNSVYEIDGELNYTDDNGEVYRIGNNLISNNTYEVNGYRYETDDSGKIASAEGKLQVKNHEGKLHIKDDKSDIGKGDEKTTDHRGHIIGDQFNGSNGMENIVAQDGDLNTGDYKNLETQLAKEVNAGKDVHMQVDMDYSGNSFRPNSFTVSYSINGEEFVKNFSNEPRGV